MESWKKLQEVIREAVDAAEISITEAVIVRTLRKNNADLIEKWVSDKLTAWVRAERRRRPDPNQLFLPGFKDLSRKLPLQKGDMELGHMNITKLRESAKLIVKEVSKHYVPPKAANILRLVSLMQPYSRKHRGLTVTRYYELRADEAVIGIPAKEASRDLWTHVVEGGKK
jgi:hypothetical protein